METTYMALIDLNGTGKNKMVRRMSDADLSALFAYAKTQCPMPHSTTNLIAGYARRELRRRAV
jgi:hypothetical protein